MIALAMFINSHQLHLVSIAIFQKETKNESKCLKRWKNKSSEKWNYFCFARKIKRKIVEFLRRKNLAEQMYQAVNYFHVYSRVCSTQLVRVENVSCF